ncbi:response regulator transcription factor [Limnohabitans sp. Hippo3]|uniref:response regulator transcription factor n=1 Tax=Limnohabitans sp. Hippo3 TaxID=1597956 RepID=UPI000D396480|nr:response regulator transcription factor [Limnohabitans sp. Hippo3]PUE42232.1 DNA-binding response regulator [Limnohabitans sp. Hippo3]
MCIDLVLADPYPVMLEGLTHVFQDSSDFSVKSCVRNGDEALQALQQFQPHILVMDLSLSQRNGLALLEEIKAQNLPTRPVVFTGAPIGEVMRALDLDVPGLVSKEKSRQILTRCIKSVHEGGKWLDRDLSVRTMSLLLEQQKKKANASQLLTPRELTVARMVTEGWPNKKIASKLFISEGTAKLHLHHIYQKLNCPGRMSLQRYMQEHGLL